MTEDLVISRDVALLALLYCAGDARRRVRSLRHRAAQVRLLASFGVSKRRRSQRPGRNFHQ